MKTKEGSNRRNRRVATKRSKYCQELARMEGRNHMNGLKRKEEVRELDGSVETNEPKYQVDGKS